ncbi:Heat shock 70 kDa protein 12A, partial [Orchesella cincta]
VNRDKKLHPRDELPSCVIALDLGSRGSGYAYWIREESEFVRIGNVDGVSSCPASHKAPSWVMFDDLYLDGDEDGESADSIRPGFGFQALDKYLTDDAHGQLSWRWREHFHEAKSFPYTLDSKASDDDLIFMMKSAIRHYARQAMEQISQRRRGAPQGSTVTLIAIPSTFDQRARQLVREAALESGFLKESDSIALIEDSIASGLYALHTLKSKINKESNAKEMSYLSVDCGASYLHFSGYQATEGKLRQLLLPRSDPLIDSPESLFEAELSTVFTPNYIFNYQNKYKAGWLKLMTEFEHAKNRYDPLSRQNYYVFVPSSFVDHFRRFTSMEVEDALESSDMVWSKTGAIGIPHWKMQRFLQPLLDYVNDKVVTSMKKHKFEHLVLTGGRAGAKFYVDAITATAKGFGATLHVPKEYNAAVLQGSTISVTNLAPRLVIRSRFSIGVGVMTPFSDEIHPEEKRVMRDGKSWCADVWDSLIKADQELELNRVIIKRSYVGAQPGQSLLVLPLFKSPDEPKFVTESSVQKCCELKFTSGQRAWQEVELVLVCRPSELLIKAMDGGVMKSYVVVDFTD